MTLISITNAREKLPKIANEVYFKGKTFILTKRGIPMAKIVKADGSAKRTVAKKSNIKEAIKLAGKIRGVWNEEWKNKSTEEVADLLAERAWNSHAR